MNYIKLAEAHLQRGHGGNYRSSSTDIHLRAYTLVNQLLFNNEMSSDSFFLRVKKLSERTKESFTFLSAFINTELCLLTSEKLQSYRASSEKEHYRLSLTESEATLRLQISVEGGLGRWFISSSGDVLNQLPGHGKAPSPPTDQPVRLAWGRLVTLLQGLLLVCLGQVPDYLLNVLSNLCSANSAHAATAGSNQQVSEVKAVFIASA